MQGVAAFASSVEAICCCLSAVILNIGQKNFLSLYPGAIRLAEGHWFRPACNAGGARKIRKGGLRMDRETKIWATVLSFVLLFMLVICTHQKYLDVLFKIALLETVLAVR